MQLTNDNIDRIAQKMRDALYGKVFAIAQAMIVNKPDPRSA